MWSWREKERRLRSDLGSALQRGDVAVVKQLTGRGADVNLASRMGFTPLIMAAGEGDADWVSDLVARGARVDVCDRWSGLPALLWAAGGSDRTLAWRLLGDP